MKLLNSHEKLVQQMDVDLKKSNQVDFNVDPLDLPKNVINSNDNMPELAKMQIELLVVRHSFVWQALARKVIFPRT